VYDRISRTFGIKAAIFIAQSVLPIKAERVNVSNKDNRTVLMYLIVLKHISKVVLRIIIRRKVKISRL
jgi:hypothetical protein